MRLRHQFSGLTWKPIRRGDPAVGGCISWRIAATSDWMASSCDETSVQLGEFLGEPLLYGPVSPSSTNALTT